MRLKSFSAEGFRNLSIPPVEFDHRLTLLSGFNGAGKTSILEAISFLIRGESFRPYAQRKHFIHERKQRLLVQSVFQRVSGLEIDVEVEHFDQKWSYRVNGKPARPQSLRGRIAFVSFSPDDHELLRGAPESRRDFLDQIFSDVVPGYSEALSRYVRSWQSRNRLLKKAQESGLAAALLSRDQEFQSWNEIFIASGLALDELRFLAWEHFSSFMKESFESLELGLVKEFQINWGRDPSKHFAQQLSEGLVKDLRIGWSSLGPHRLNFEIIMKDGTARTQASQGQSRLFALVMKWVAAKWIEQVQGEAPLFLVDDFSSELDLLRRSKILERFLNLKAQVFLTTTEGNLVDTLGFSEYTKWEVLDGKITRSIDDNNPHPGRVSATSATV